ncbi:MAG: DEAD/SNF2-like helicase, partial [Edafosvirus sp.]
IEFIVNPCKTDKIYNVKAFDASSLLISINNPVVIDLEGPFKNIVEHALYIKDNEYKQFELNMLMRHIAWLRNKMNDFRIFDWKKYVEKSKIDQIVWRQLITRFMTDSEIQIGPVNRSGNKVQNSISFLYEGVMWRLLNMLNMLYPEAIKASGDLKFQINKNTIGYKNIMDILKILFFKKKSENVKNKTIVEIKTILWDHQHQTVEKIVNGFINFGRKGYGDASCTGSGKSLVALAVMAKILKHNTDKNINNYIGFLVLLPTTKLYKTWNDEINKHTEGFDVIEQKANGFLNKMPKQNSIVLSTLGRTREHPLDYPWQLVVIDECLTVQNKDSLQTESAWRQVACSQFGTLMMSAGFFRSRFDKLFYMLKMLQSGLPEKIEYLDTILSECIVCNISENSRKWITNITKYKLPNELRIKYDKIASQNKAYEKLYIELTKFLYDNCDYISYFINKIKKLEEKDEDCKILIYAKSKEEANAIAECGKINRYPDMSSNYKHTVVSYNEGTYGLNDLVSHNTILMRPYLPDLLFQMKGRLDRPGQQKDILNLEYILIENTIEEAWLYRLEMAQNFHNKFIMPLAEFYELAVKVNK